ncbi:MerR family transcriptional regulator [Bradyrhizobium erythrophlei]|uniref:Chaperone modulatory protein CbpM n=1 Tax=Bradyrhizobium erythrophlei TaxID=1437360 RepID=A0A1H5D411_9BRAD|nr:MerR family transcriptional regulator [Bradyrhizobium erythrophlei]SED73582.1 chaperone modulatory protein CbpM [Bradyrhizobium erythrophlei]
MQGQTLEFWLEQEWLIPERTITGMIFTEGDVARARFIQDLAAGMGVNDEGIDVVLHLVDQLHGMRRVLVRLHDEVSGEAT